LYSQANEQTAARREFEALAQLRDYYGFLAADHIDQPYALADRPAEQRHLDALNMNQAVSFARALFDVGDLNLARLQWAFATRAMSEDELVSVALLAHQWGWHDRAIFTMARAKYWDDIAARFPLAHKSEITELARQAGLNPAWVYGVIRQESAFVNDARSGVGALGLMQLMPATAKRVARRQKVKWRGRETLLKPEVNVRLGSAYLSELFSQCGSHAALATASYNAGPKRVKRWLPKVEPMDAQLWIETIPFAETRQFTKNVFAFTAVYEKLLGRKTRRLSDKLTLVPTKAC
jgi:soluble lytic murein transglycosylase